MVREGDEAGRTTTRADPGEAALGDFPPCGAARAPFGLSGAARRRGLSLRPATRDDLAFLRSLFGDLRRPELDGAGWPAPLREAFCSSQFALQHTSFIRHFPRADFLVILRDAAPIGRLYLDRTPPVFHVVEIGLVTVARGSGLGSLLVDAIKAAARRASAEAVTLQVHRHNHAARRFYARAGFETVGEEASHWLMRWER